MAKSKRIHKFPGLGNNYSGPRLYAVDVIDPADPTKYRTRYTYPETVLHFELLAPSEPVTEGQTLIVPTLPLNFEVRNCFVTFTRLDNLETIIEQLKEQIADILEGISIGVDNCEALAFALMVYLIYGDGEVINSYTGYTKDPPTNGESIELIFSFIDTWLDEFGSYDKPALDVLHTACEEIDLLLNLSQVTMTFGEGPEFNNTARWEQLSVEPGESSLEATLVQNVISHSNPLGLKIETLANNVSGVGLKGLTLWLVGSFQFPIDPARTGLD